MTTLRQQQDALGFVHLVKRHFDRASISLPREVWERMNAILAGEGGQQSNPATLREALTLCAQLTLMKFCKQRSVPISDLVMRKVADEAVAEVEALVATGTEAALCEVCNAPREIAGGEHVCGLSASAAYSLGFARGINSQPAQAAASPEGEGREAISEQAHELALDTIDRLQNERDELRHELDAALRQLATPSGGDLDTPSKLSGSMAIARIEEASWWVQLFTAEEFVRHKAEINARMSKLEHDRAVAMQTPAPQQLQAESKTGAAPSRNCRWCGNTYDSAGNLWIHENYMCSKRLCANRHFQP